jgi:hypothetical protein
MHTGDLSNGTLAPKRPRTWWLDQCAMFLFRMPLLNYVRTYVDVNVV